MIVCSRPLFVLLFLGTSTVLAEEKSPRIELTEVKASELTKAIASHEGKVVVVDIWAEFCIPCRKKFPQIVRLHKELASEGLVILTVTIDEKEDRARALEFLTKSDATFRNYHLIDTDGNVDALQASLATKAVPIVHVFDRKGKKTSFETGIKDDEVEKLIRDLVKQKD
jgi:thiol-disulfide isomerase/thioredoxin